jgi:hypothetical protein
VQILYHELHISSRGINYTDESSLEEVHQISEQIGKGKKTRYSINGHTRLLIARMIIVPEYSFRMVEHKWFNVLMRWMNINYEWIGRKTIKNECMKIFESEKDQLKKSLKEADSIGLTIDLPHITLMLIGIYNAVS